MLLIEIKVEKQVNVYKRNVTLLKVCNKVVFFPGDCTPLRKLIITHDFILYNSTKINKYKNLC